ncbi:MAG: DUF4377 domain-containing protein [Rikenellaceae bacterium]|nr:DUF4377 domain-containing protein [Rikenellaceae bacterium]
MKLLWLDLNASYSHASLASSPAISSSSTKQTTWSRITESIEGFDYMPGYEYVILIEKENLKNPLQDYFGKYILKQIISKTQQESSDLPRCN